MISIENVKNYVKSEMPGTPIKIQLGSINANAEEFIAIYPEKPTRDNFLALGGSENTNVDYSACKIVVHYGKNMVSSEEMAKKLHSLFFGIDNKLIDGQRAYICQPSEINWQGRDVKGVYEYAFTVNFISERANNNGISDL